MLPPVRRTCGQSGSPFCSLPYTQAMNRDRIWSVRPRIPHFLFFEEPERSRRRRSGRHRLRRSSGAITCIARVFLGFSSLVAGFGEVEIMEALFGKGIGGNGIVATAFARSQVESRSESVGMRPVQASSSSPQGQTRGLQDEIASTCPATALPVSSSRSIFTGPLKFFWFAKQKDAQTIELTDEAWESPPEREGELDGSEGADTAEDDSTDNADKSSRKGWVYTVWGLRSLLGEKPSPPEDISFCDTSTREGPTEEKPDKKLPPEVKTTEEAPTSVGAHAGGCSECDMDGTEGCLVDSAFTLEVPHTRVAHDKESFVKFLHRLPLSEVKVISRMSHLCKLAYAIQEIKPSDLLENHDLSFVTSSLDQKAEALAREQAADKSSGCQGAECSQKFPINPASAYALASAVASYLHSHTRALLQLKRQCDSENKAQPENDDQKGATAPVRSTVEDAKGSVPDYNSEEVASMIASSPMTAVVAAKDGARDAVAKDLQSLHSCPCEWYCCDDKQSLTRYFVIQGSESLASWQANLLFEPTFFEDPNLGVFVHRGIYEAAKGLYQQVLPHVLEHLKEHGESARLCFTGHSLGGSLSTLVSLMLRIRGVVQPSTLLPVYTFGSPCTMCGGDFLLNKLGLPRTQVRSVMLHRDIVPRTFACDYPDHVAEVLKRINGSFRDHPCLNNQRLLYAPMGEFLILQPSEQDAPSHPLLPQGQGLYALRHPQTSSTDKKQDIELRAAQRAFLNSPHPLEILSDRTAYGSEGTISRDHDPRSYMKAISNVSREEGKKFRRLRREQRRRLWWPVMAADISSVLDSSSSGDSGSRSNVASSSITSSGFQHTQLVLLGFLSAKLLLTEGLATFFTWI